MFGFVRQLWWFIKKNWYLYIAILFVGIIGTVLLLVPAQVLGDLCEKILIGDLTAKYLLLNITLYYLGINVLIFLVFTTKKILQNRLKIRLYYALQVKYMDSIMIQDASFFERFQSGDLLTRALGDVKSVNMSGGNRLLNIIMETISIGVTFVAMILINPRLTLWSILPLPIIFVVNIILRRKVKNNWRKVREASSNMGNVVLESITNVRTIRAFSKEEENYKKVISYSSKVYEIEKRNLKINVLFQPIYQSIVAVSTIIAYFIGSQYIVNEVDGFMVSDLIKFIAYLNMFASPLTSIGNMLTNFYQSLISMDRLNDVFLAKCQVNDRPNAKKVKNISSIEFKDFSFSYPNESNEILSGVSLVIKQGETVGIVGKTGSGKSTLVRQLIHQFPVNDGQIFINGEDINDLQKESVRQLVSYVPQEHILFSRSVYKNVALGSVSHVSEEEVDMAIEKADFSKDIENLPLGLDTVVGEYGVTLSGGQKQRLAIARAFMKNSAILILDDSLSAVDGKTEANIIHNIKEYRNNKTNIIVAHRLSAVMHANKIIVLDDGKIVESGSHEELMKLHGWYHRLFLEQQMDDKDGEDNE